MSRRRYDKNSSRPGAHSGFTGVFRDAINLEDAAHAVNFINARIRRERADGAEQSAKSKVTLGGGADLAAWLKKDVP